MLARPGLPVGGLPQAPEPLYFFGVEALWPDQLDLLANQVEEMIVIEMEGLSAHD
jgi:hypothetical protein